MTMKTTSVKQSGMPISTKHVHEISEYIKSKNIDTAIIELESVLKKEKGIPFRKYPSKGHKHGVPTGYPQKATKMVIRLLKQLKANAKVAGAEKEVVIKRYNLGRGAYPRYSSGAISRGGKHTNLEIIAEFEAKEPVKTEEKTSVEPKANETTEKKVEEQGDQNAKDNK